MNLVGIIAAVDGVGALLVSVGTALVGLSALVLAIRAIKEMFFD